MRITICLAMLASLFLAACSERETSAPAHRETASAAEASNEATPNLGVALTEEETRAAGIEVSVAGPRRLREVLTVYGSIVPNAERVRNVTARFPGEVRSVAKTVGSAVRAGELLASIESNDSLETYPITAPIAGIVTARETNPGETVGDRALFVIADLSTVWCEIALFPRDVTRVKPGQSVRVTSVDGAVTGVGRITWISALGDTSNQSIKGRVVLDNANRQWTPGLFVSAEITVNETELPLAVSAEAVQTLDARPVVFVMSNTGFVARPVGTGRTDGQIIEILSGLSAGERYVTANSFVLKAQLERGEEGDE